MMAGIMQKKSENNIIILDEYVNCEALRVRAKINSQIFCVEAPAWQGAKMQEYQAYSEFSQRTRWDAEALRM